MRAIVHYRFGSPDVLELEEIPRPTPANTQVLVKVHAVSANPADWHTLRAEPFFIRLLGDGLFRPKHKVLGIDIAGTVEAVGRDVTAFQPGDTVFGTSKWGGFAEYACAAEDRLVPKPSGITFEQAASVPVAGVTALQALRDHGRVQPGQKVLVNGASGGVGTFAVQIAKALGAEVTGVCSAGNMDLVRAIGADRVIDYRREDCTRTGDRYDLVLDTAAYRSIGGYRRVMRPEGVYVMVGGDVGRIFQVLILGRWLAMTTGMKMGFMVAKMNQADLQFLKELLEARKIVPVIDRRYPLSETADALRYLETRRARGKVVITTG